MANRQATALFLLIWLVGVIGMFGLLYLSGYYKVLVQLRNDGWQKFPGTDTPILTRFTGIEPWDKLNTLGLVMFSPILDGTTPHLSLFSFQYAGHLVNVLTIIMVEGTRHGNQGVIMSL